MPRPLLCLLCLWLLLFPTRSRCSAAEPQRVQVGTYLLSVGKLDISSNSYYMDFYLIFHCDRPCNPGNFEIMNSRSFTVDKQEDEPTYKVFRIKGELTNNLNLRPFPFDQHDLVIILEDKLQTEEAQVYVPDPARTGLHGDMVVAGWHIPPGRYGGAVRSDRYAVFGQSYSRYTFSVTLDRPWLSAFLKGLLPALLIVISGLLALLIGGVGLIGTAGAGSAVILAGADGSSAVGAARHRARELSARGRRRARAPGPCGPACGGCLQRRSQTGPRR